MDELNSQMKKVLLHIEEEKEKKPNPMLRLHTLLYIMIKSIPLERSKKYHYQWMLEQIRSYLRVKKRMIDIVLVGLENAS